MEIVMAIHYELPLATCLLGSSRTAGHGISPGHQCQCFIIFVGSCTLHRSFNRLQPQFLYLYTELLTFPSSYKIM